MFVITLLAIGLLCLLFNSTRLTGVAGLTLLSLIYPPLFAGVLVLGSIGFSVYLQHKKGN